MIFHLDAPSIESMSFLRVSHLRDSHGLFQGVVVGTDRMKFSNHVAATVQGRSKVKADAKAEKDDRQ